MLIFDLPGVELNGLPRVAQQEGSMLGCDFNRLHRLGYHLLRFFLDSILEIVVKLLVALFQLYRRSLSNSLRFIGRAECSIVGPRFIEGPLSLSSSGGNMLCFLALIRAI